MCNSNKSYLNFKFSSTNKLPLIFKVCQHEGTCELEENSLGGYACDCLEDFRGRNCEIHSLCENSGGCQNGATCRVEKAEVLCDCSYGYVGKFCETGNYLDLPNIGSVFWLKLRDFLSILTIF